MRRNHKVKTIWLVALFLLLGGCYQSNYPLGSPAEGKIDPRIVGTWRCIQGGIQENKPFLITVMPFDDNQYYIGITMEGEKSLHYRAYSSLIQNTILVNLQELKPSIEPSAQKWIFVRYTLLKPNILQVELVRDKPFKGIDSSPDTVRKFVERMIENPELYQEHCVCTKLVEKE